MDNILGFALLCALIFSSYKYEKKIKEKTERYQWLLAEQNHFHIIALDFEKQCKDIIERDFPKHTRGICNNRNGCLSELSLMIMLSNNRQLSDEFDNLKQEYSTQYPTKYESRYGTFYFERYPNFIIDDYLDEINRIHNHYRYLSNLMYDQIMGMRSLQNIDNSIN